MRKLIESILVSLDGVIAAPDRWATFDAEAKLKEGVVIAPPWARPVAGSGAGAARRPIPWGHDAGVWKRGTRPAAQVHVDLPRGRCHPA